MKSGNDHTKRIPSSASTDEKLGNNRHHQNDVEADEPLREWARPITFSKPSSSSILLLTPGPVPESRTQSFLPVSSLRMARRLRGPARPREIISLIDS